MTVPLPIETQRLILRPFADEDLDDVAAIYADPRVMEHVCLGVLDRQASAALLGEYAQLQATLGFSTWAVVERASGRVVGDAGFAVFTPTGEPELGFTFATEVWGRGYATEAAQACIEAALAHLPWSRLVAKVEPANERSQRVLERVGMRRAGDILLAGRPHLLFTMERG